MSEDAIPAYNYDDFASVYEKKAYHDFLVARRASTVERRSKRHPRSVTESAIRWRRFWSVAFTVVAWSGVFVCGCMSGAAVTIIVRDHEAVAEAGIFASIGIMALTGVLTVRRFALKPVRRRPDPAPRIPRLRLPRSSAIG